VPSVALRVVEAFDIIEHIGPRVVPSTIDMPMRALDLQTREEALHGRIVPDVAAPTHAALDAILSKHTLELFARVPAKSPDASQ